jgi:hypothetical protein
MNQPKSKYAVQKILDPADVHIDGHRPWDIRVWNQKFYERVLAGGSLALGESYMDDWWNCEALDQLFDRIMSAYLDKQAKKSAQVLTAVFKARITNLQRRSKAYDRLPPPPKVFLRLKTGTVSDPSMTPPSWHGTAIFETAGIKSRMRMISASTACGPTIFFPVLVVSEPEETKCGRSYFQEKASEGVTGEYVCVRRRRCCRIILFQ